MYNVCAHNSLPPSAILVLGILKKKEDDEQFLGAAKMLLLDIWRSYFGSLKGCYQRRYYYRECLYCQIRLKVRDSEEKLAFLSRLPLRCHNA